MKILFFGIYKPDYSRNRVLIRALKMNDIELIECRSEYKNWRKYLDLFLKHWRLRGYYDFMLVAFPGQEIMFLAKAISQKPIIFDVFTSHYGGYILDRAYFAKNSLRAFYYRFVDRWSCKMANLVLLDTNTHIDFFVNEYGLQKEKFKRIWVSTDTSVFYPRQKPARENFMIHFHGNFIPVQGVEYIIKAAKLLENENIKFNIIGKGQMYKKNRLLAEELNIKNINFIDPVPYEVLPDYMAQADVCLGLFADNPRLESAIPNKIFEALAMKLATINADTLAMRELLVDGQSTILCKRADAQDLAEKILMLKNNPVLKEKIAHNGYEIFKKQCIELELGKELLCAIKKMN